MSHLSVKINNHYLTVPEDFSVDFEDVNPLWNDYESFAADIELPVEPNRAVLTDVDTVQSDTRLSSIDGQPMQLIIDGLPFRSGKAQTQEGESIIDTVMLSMSQTSETLDDIVANLNCRDVPVKDKIQIGEKIGNVAVAVAFATQLKIEVANYDGGFLSGSWQLGDNDGHGNIQEFSFVNQLELPALGFSTPSIINTRDGKAEVDESFINTTLDYTGKPYCNARVCYRHYRKEEDGTSGKTLSTDGQYDPFYVLNADRAQSGICFYVLYFLDCLFHHLGFRYDNSHLTAVGDMNKLCFFTTHCKYDVERKNEVGSAANGFDFDNIDKINEWLAYRGTKGRLSFTYQDKKSLDSITGTFSLKNSLIPEWQEYTYKVGEKLPSGHEVKSIAYHCNPVYSMVFANVMKMYANSDNFPNATVKSILDSLWAGWGIKFVTDYELRSVTPIFIRDVLRDTSDPIEMDVQLVSVHRINEKVSGVRMHYSAESDAKEQAQNIKEGKRDYDTDFDYIDYNNVNTSKTYLDILQVQSPTDMTCYITPNTGNAYRIKVDSDAKTTGEMRPTAFEVGGYKGVEVGDCSDKNKDYIEELTIDLTPALMTDVNGKNEREAGGDTATGTSTSGGADFTSSGINLNNRKQVLAVFVDEDMWHENIEMKIQNAMGNNYMDASLDCILTTDECYDPSSTDDGNSPLQHHDWGSAINIMRGGGADMQIQKYDYNYDGCGNYKWRTTAGDYTMNPDCIDNWGNDYDYNGTSSGIGDDERFSLKIQAYKEVNGQILCNADEVDKDGNITRKVRSRGLKDTFMSEYIHWLMNRKLVEIKFRCEAAQLVGIQWDKRYRIGEYVFFWNKLNYTATAKDGIGVVTAQVYI